MPTNAAHDEAMLEGFLGISRKELEAMSDLALAQWQGGWRQGTDRHILAEKEWTRRLASRQLREQFDLEERIASTNRWWAIAAALVGVLGTLLGAAVGARLQAPSVASTAPEAKTTQSKAKAQELTLSASTPAPSANSASQALLHAPARPSK